MTVNDLSHIYFALQGYQLSDQLADSSNPQIMYYGYVNREGKWYILKADDSTGTYRFVKGDSGYTTAWIARESASYDYFYNVFK